MMLDAFPEQKQTSKILSSLKVIILTLFTVLQNAARGQATNESLKIIEDKEKFLRDFAKMMEFDPLIFSNWRNQTSNIKANGVIIHLLPTIIFWLIWICFFRVHLFLQNMDHSNYYSRTPFLISTLKRKVSGYISFLFKELKLFQIFAVENRKGTC